MELLAEDNHCGQSLLRLLSRGHSTIAEVLRLSDVVPTVFSNPSRHEQQRFGELLSLDFTYFKSSELHEARLSSSSADEELRELCCELLPRYYRLFAGVKRFAEDLNRLLEAINKGNFVQQSLEGLFLNEDGAQILCELLHCYGVLLLLLDARLEGPLRERLLVAYYRYSGHDEENFDDVCKMMRSTGYSRAQGAKRPQNYPESFFSRIPVPDHFVRLVLSRLRSDDLYHSARCYPDPEHRSVSMAEQAAMVFVCLYFSPDTLKNEQAVMREVVDKFFPDNWVISIYMGTVVNVADAWEPYKAAKAALANTLQISNVKDIAMRNAHSLEKVLPDTNKLLLEGAVSEKAFLDHIVKVLNVIRECNVTVRWIMLHTTPLGPGVEHSKKCRQLREQVLAECAKVSGESSNVFCLLVNTSEFELNLRSTYRRALDEREQNWQRVRLECRERLRELADYFSGESVLVKSKATKNEHLREWFIERERQVAILDLENPLAAGRLAARILESMAEALELDVISGNMQVKQSMLESKECLHQLIRMAGLKEEVLITLQRIGDISYAWQMIHNFEEVMQQTIRKDPGMVGRLRATFLKLSYALEGPVFRISQARSKDLVSVSQYYSSELVSFVRDVLQVIPETIFGLLNRIIDIQTNEIEMIPTRLDKDKVKDYAQLDKRFEVAKLTHSISVFTDGMLALKSTLVGIIKIDPKQLLEEGIRKEIVRQVTNAFNQHLTFSKNKGPSLKQRLSDLTRTMLGFPRSFEYIQDYIGLPGLKIWQEEFSRIIGFHTEWDSKHYTANTGGHRPTDCRSPHQNKAVPIHVSEGESCGTFMDGLMREVIKVTSPRWTVFSRQNQGWYDAKTSDEVATFTLFSMLEAAVGIKGLIGLDHLWGLRAANILSELCDTLEENIFSEKSWVEALENLGDSLNPTANVIAHPSRFYQAFTGRSPKILSTLVDSLLSLGQLQLLRRLAASKLSLSAQFDAKVVQSTVQTLNKSVLLEIRKEKEEQTLKLEDPFLYELSSYLRLCGISEPKVQVYLKTRLPPKLAELVFLGLLTALARGTYSPRTGGLVTKRGQDPLDGHVFALGIACFLHQYPSNMMQTVIAYSGQYVRSFTELNSHAKASTETPPEVQNMVIFLEELAEVKPEAKSMLNEHLPSPMSELLSMSASS